MPKKVELTSSKYFELSAAEWKVLIREHITPIIEKELQMKQIGDYLWASEYNSMGMRKVLSFFWINSAYATFKWGWNFKFMPSTLVVKLSGQEQIKVFLHIYTKCQRIFTTVAVEVKEKEKHMIELLYLGFITMKIILKI